MSELPKLPGQEIEKAAGEVLTDAGKSLTGALREIVGAWSERVAAPNRARADEIKKDAAHIGDLRRSREQLDEQRRREIEEIDHRLLLLRRAQGRTDAELIHGQESVEYVFRKAIENNSSDPNKLNERSIDRDWLRRFFKYVAEVDEQTILDVLAEALSQAAIKGPPVLSPKALDTLRFCDARILKMFEFAAQELTLFSSVPPAYLDSRAQKCGVEFDISLLSELGLVKEERIKHYEVLLGSFGMKFFYDAGERFDFSLIKLTYVGRSIENLMSRLLLRAEQAYMPPRNGSEIFSVQLKLGLDVGAARDLGTALVSDLAESWAIGLEALLYLAHPETALSTERRTLNQPFGLKNIIGLDLICQENAEIVWAFVEPFNYFDDHQLSTIVRND